MAGVGFVFVRDDAGAAEALADAFDRAGYSIDPSVNADAATVILWSRRAVRSLAFREAAERALATGRTVIVSLDAPAPDAGVPSFDLSAWDGDEEAPLDPVFEAVDSIIHPVYSNVIELPGPVYEDAEFVETNAALSAWEAPIPTEILRPPPKTGAPAPRRDFRRRRDGHPRAYAALALVTVALAGGGVFAMNAVLTTQTPLRIEAGAALESNTVSLAFASEEAIGLDDIAPAEAAPAGSGAQARGVEPGTRLPARRAVRRDRAGYTPPAPIPDDIVAELQRTEEKTPPG